MRFSYVGIAHACAIAAAVCPVTAVARFTDQRSLRLLA
ncbi:MAG: hypothetical protein QOK16_1871, partial [Solirubrobacteraceae bacterium]|nr:hypothetical protein [Solirubrobacteraceae bacterium]